MRLGGLGITRRRRVPWAFVAVLLAIPMMTAACSGPAPNEAACVRATNKTVAQLQGGLAESGTVRHARVFTRASDAVFVSAEFRPSDKAEDVKGDILTWFTTSIDSGLFEAVDAHARELSSWRHAGFDVRESGAITSRGCVLPVRGKSKADCGVGLEAFCE